MPPRYRGVSDQHLQTGAGSGGRGMTLRWRCGGAARRSKPQRPGALPHVAGPTGNGNPGTVRNVGMPFGPTAVDRPPRREGRRPEMAIHRGRCGANLKHRARDAMGTADLRNNGLRHASMSRGVEARGSEHLVCAYGVNVCASGPLAFRAPSVFFRERAVAVARRRTPRRKEQGRWSFVRAPRSPYRPVTPARYP